LVGELVVGVELLAGLVEACRAAAGSVSEKASPRRLSPLTSACIAWIADPRPRTRGLRPWNADSAVCASWFHC
jgi:hypothetical protein